MKKTLCSVFLLALTLSACNGGSRPHGKLMPGVSRMEEAAAVENSDETADDPDMQSQGELALRGADSILLPAPLTQCPEQVLVRKAYVASYNKDTRLPNWVAWVLTANHTEGPYKRGGVKFHEDEEVPEPRVTTYDYVQSGYDRGHMCPSADNRWDAEAQDECFLMTNICPQNHNLNAGDWGEMENQCRLWAKKYGRIYIVCGPILFRSRHKKIGTSKVVVPEAFFKVVLCMGRQPKGIGFIYRNEAGNRPKGDYVNSIDEVERITGYDFFAKLPDKIEKQVESQANIDDWY